MAGPDENGGGDGPRGPDEGGEGSDARGVAERRSKFRIIEGGQYSLIGDREPTRLERVLSERCILDLEGLNDRLGSLEGLQLSISDEVIGLGQEELRHVNARQLGIYCSNYERETEGNVPPFALNLPSEYIFNGEIRGVTIALLRDIVYALRGQGLLNLFLNIQGIPDEKVIPGGPFLFSGGPVKDSKNKSMDFLNTRMRSVAGKEGVQASAQAIHAWVMLVLDAVSRGRQAPSIKLSPILLYALDNMNPQSFILRYNEGGDTQEISARSLVIGSGFCPGAGAMVRFPKNKPVEPDKPHLRIV